MDKVDACIESLANNLVSLVKCAQVGTEGRQSDELVEVCAAQIAESSRQLCDIIFEHQSRAVLCDHEKLRLQVRSRGDELEEATAEAEATCRELRRDLRESLFEMETAFYASLCPIHPSG